MLSKFEKWLLGISIGFGAVIILIARRKPIPEKFTLSEEYGHTHEWTEGARWTSSWNWHQHTVNPDMRLVLEEEGHTHDILS